MGFVTLTLPNEQANATSEATLAELKTGECATIDIIENDFKHRDRFLELGLTNGSEIKVLRKALFGDPIQIQVRGLRYALRKADAKHIKVKRSV